MQVPNARVEHEDGSVSWSKIGDNLKVRYKADKPDPEMKNWLAFSPDNLFVELNGQPITLCQELELWFNQDDGVPHARIAFNLESIDIDVDTLTHLAAFAKQ